MAKRVGSATVLFETLPSVFAYASVAGSKEGEGPLGGEIHKICPDARMGCETWEQAESSLQKEALALALQHGGITSQHIQCLFAGDLLNQCVGSTGGLANFHIPQIGLYGACSTMALGLFCAAMAIESGVAQKAAAVTSSHFCASERQFRYPLEYGGQRPQTSQWTATGSGAVIVSNEEYPIKIKGGIIGKINDLGITDANNMGAAMAPAAADTIIAFLRDTGKSPAHFDAIVTGDLGQTGSRLLCQLTKNEGVDISHNHLDCGLLLYDRQKQDVHAGGSGCGCSAVTLCSHILGKMVRKEWRNVLFVATGALHSPTTVQQGTAIPGIAHGVWLAV